MRLLGHLLESLPVFLCLPLVNDRLNSPFPLRFLLVFHLLLNGFGGLLCFIFHLAFVVPCESCSWSEGFLGSVPLLSWAVSVHTKAAVSQEISPFTRKPCCAFFEPPTNAKVEVVMEDSVGAASTSVDISLVVLVL